MDFDKILWKKDAAIQYKMVDDLVEEKLLIGKNEKNVKDLIGEPQKIDSITSTWTYGIIGRTWADFYYVDLELTFKNSKVTEVNKRVQN